MSGVTLADRFRAHLGDSPTLYGVAMRGMADDWEAGGPVREVCRGWADAPSGAVIELRLLAGLFRVVLRGQAPELVSFYPCLGGTRPAAEAWPVMRAVVASRVEELRHALEVAPQTNEIGRSLALLVGTSVAVEASGLRRVRLLELGASAGLNLLVDQIRFVGDGWACGPADSALVLDHCGATGFVPAAYEVVERRGCDRAPLRVDDADDVLRLTSFVWPWMLERHARLEAALVLARQHPVVVDRARAADWLGSQLREPTDPEVLTVVWHSITRQYWPAEEIQRVERLIDQARSRMPLAHVAMEDRTIGAEPPVVFLDGQPMATIDHHGPPLTLT